ncbi:hypothetical protein MY4038_006577 [Beauveria bassiana]
MTIGSTHKLHSKTQKETARKRGRNWLRKGAELGQKAEIICGGFFWDPTHHEWRVELHVPEGQEAPIEISQFLEKLSKHQPRAPVRRISSVTDTNEVSGETGEDECETILSVSFNATAASPKEHMDVTPEEDTIHPCNQGSNEQGVLGSQHSISRTTSSGANEESLSSAHRAPTLQTETETATATVVTAMADTSRALLVLGEIQDHVEQAITRRDRTKVPTVAHAERIAKIDVQLQYYFQRFRCLQPTDDNKTVEDDIIRYAGERKMLEVNGLGDAENAYENQIAAVLQSLSDQLITTLGPAAVNHSLRKIDVQKLEEYIPDALLNRITLSPRNVRYGVRSLQLSWKIL